ncbi:ATP/GTP-binding protein [Streptomyces sp. OF1]|uniref:ATP/GTP-binding protein n=1 Tax=Streptomyces alkaliterrae TaxID=2213162 RepID=A0A5P0YZ01_9ACTN|nr:ATP/GTP-binding protein [Streptomyces alkaliterrae]
MGECTTRKLDPQPPASSPVWGGRSPSEGAIYIRTCEMVRGGPGAAGRVAFPAGGPFFAGEAPDDEGPDPAVLAQRAIDSMLLAGPAIASPKTEGTYTVGMPMWMWVTPSATTYGPNTATASAGGVTVTATARVSRIVWDMGDGRRVTCTGPGTPYRASYGKQPSPTCGHTYRASSASQAGGTYPVTATATWEIEWSGGDQAGEVTTTRTSEAAVSVGEGQAVGR